MTTSVNSRPTFLTAVLILVILGGVGWILTGVVALRASGGGGSAVVGVAYIVLGLVYFAVAKGLAGGNPLARVVVAVVAALQVIAAVLEMFRTHDDMAPKSSGIVGGLFGVAILVILFSKSANAYFAARRS